MNKAQRRIAKLRYKIMHSQGSRRKGAFITLMLISDIEDAYNTLLAAHVPPQEMRDIEQTFLIGALHQEIFAALRMERNRRIWAQFDFQGVAQVVPL